MSGAPSQEWLLFFCDTPRRAWWANVLRPGYRHIVALGWHAYAQRWVCFDPTLHGTLLVVLTEEQSPKVIDELLERSTAVLRFPSLYGRGAAPAFPWCVGAIKSLLGIRSAALTPWQLYCDLRARGAAVIATPCVAAEQRVAAPSSA